MTAYAYMLAQVPVIIAHLRDSMIPLAGTDYDRTRVDGTKEQPLPFRIQPMQDADELWAALTDYGNEIARHIHPSPYALLTKLRASTQWHDAGDAAHTITAWLIEHEERIAQLPDDDAREQSALGLFPLIGQLLGRYDITPRRLRVRRGRTCVICGEDAIYAEWEIGRNGQVATTVQCTVCGQRYEEGMLPTRDQVLALPGWSGS